MRSTKEWLPPAVITMLSIVACDISQAAEDDVTVWVSRPGPRWEFALGVQSWPALADLGIPNEGAFDNVGFNLSGAVHWPYRRFGRSELLAGADLGFMSHESDIRFTSDTLVARNVYFTPSIKWMFANRYSLDVGLGYYFQDMAEIAGEYPNSLETRLWEDGSIGGYIGGHRLSFLFQPACRFGLNALLGQARALGGGVRGLREAGCRQSDERDGGGRRALEVCHSIVLCYATDDKTPGFGSPPNGS